MSHNDPVPPFTWPAPGAKRTWQPSETYVFPGCTGLADCACACAVGVHNTGRGVTGCDCPGHDARRARLTAPEKSDGPPWWDALRDVRVMRRA